MSIAATAVSQFQFEEEKDWDQGEAVDYEGWMTVDCKSLSKAMLSLPLHQRLGLDEKYFTVSTEYYIFRYNLFSIIIFSLIADL